MALSASGVLSKPLEAWGALLSNCSAWQAWGSFADAAAALARVYDDETEIDETANKSTLRPFNVAGLEEVHPVGDRGAWGGELVAYFEDNVDAAYAKDPEQAMMYFRNKLGAVVDGVLADSEADTTGTKLWLRRGEAIKVEGPFRSSEETRDDATAGAERDHIWARVRFPWGPEGVA